MTKYPGSLFPMKAEDKTFRNEAPFRCLSPIGDELPNFEVHSCFHEFAFQIELSASWTNETLSKNCNKRSSHRYFTSLVLYNIDFNGITL